jgi:hypothetical protein
VWLVGFGGGVVRVMPSWSAQRGQRLGPWRRGFLSFLLRASACVFQVCIRDPLVEKVSAQLGATSGSSLKYSLSRFDHYVDS